MVVVFLLRRLRSEVVSLKSWFIFFLVFVLLVIPVYAADYSEDLIYDEEITVAPFSDPDMVAEEDSLYDETETELYPFDTSDDLLSESGVSVMSLNPITPSETSGLKSVLLEILGDYDAIIVEYNSGNYTSREVFQDDVWLCSFWLLAIMVYCLFKLLGGWLVRKQ